MCDLVVERSSDNLPQSTTEDLFSVSGGKVLITGLFGKITSTIQAIGQTAVISLGSKAILSFNPSGLSAGILIGGTDVAETDALTGATPGNTPYIVDDGVTVNFATTQSATGQMEWVLMYVPITPGSKVVAA